MVLPDQSPPLQRVNSPLAGKAVRPPGAASDRRYHQTLPMDGSPRLRPDQNWKDCTGLDAVDVLITPTIADFVLGAQSRRAGS